MCVRLLLVALCTVPSLFCMQSETAAHKKSTEEAKAWLLAPFTQQPICEPSREYQKKLEEYTKRIKGLEVEVYEKEREDLQQTLLNLLLDGPPMQSVPAPGNKQKLSNFVDIPKLQRFVAEIMPQWSADRVSTFFQDEHYKHLIDCALGSGGWRLLDSMAGVVHAACQKFKEQGALAKQRTVCEHLLKLSRVLHHTGYPEAQGRALARLWQLQRAVPTLIANDSTLSSEAKKWLATVDPKVSFRFSGHVWKDLVQEPTGKKVQKKTATVQKSTDADLSPFLLSQAIQAYEKKQYDKSAEYCIGLTRSCDSKRSEFKQAVGCLEKLARQHQNTCARYALGIVTVQDDRAIDYFLQAINSNSSLPLDHTLVVAVVDRLKAIPENSTQYATACAALYTYYFKYYKANYKGKPDLGILQKALGYVEIAVPEDSNEHPPLASPPAVIEHAYAHILFKLHRPADAERYLQRAVRRGDPYAQLNWALSCFEKYCREEKKSNLDTGVESLLRAAKVAPEGVKSTIARLLAATQDGILPPVIRDTLLANGFVSDPAQQDDLIGQALNRYDDGYHQEAVALLEEAADKGSTSACYFLAHLYITGHYVTQSYEKTLKYIQQGLKAPAIHSSLLLGLHKLLSNLCAEDAYLPAYFFRMSVLAQDTNRVDKACELEQMMLKLPVLEKQSRLSKDSSLQKLWLTTPLVDDVCRYCARQKDSRLLSIFASYCAEHLATYASDELFDLEKCSPLFEPFKYMESILWNDFLLALGSKSPNILPEATITSCRLSLIHLERFLECQVAQGLLARGSQDLLLLQRIVALVRLSDSKSTDEHKRRALEMLDASAELDQRSAILRNNYFLHYPRAASAQADAAKVNAAHYKRMLNKRREQLSFALRAGQFEDALELFKSIALQAPKMSGIEVKDYEEMIAPFTQQLFERLTTLTQKSTKDDLRLAAKAYYARAYHYISLGAFARRSGEAIEEYQVRADELFRKMCTIEPILGHCTLVHLFSTDASHVKKNLGNAMFHMRRAVESAKEVGVDLSEAESRMLADRVGHLSTELNKSEDQNDKQMLDELMQFQVNFCCNSEARSKK